VDIFFGYISLLSR